MNYFLLQQQPRNYLTDADSEPKHIPGSPKMTPGIDQPISGLKNDQNKQKNNRHLDS